MPAPHRRLQGVFSDSSLRARRGRDQGSGEARGAPAIDQIAMGCVLSAGQAKRRRGRRESPQGGRECPRHDHQQMCGSGMQAAILAHDMLVAGSADCVVAAAWKA